MAGDESSLEREQKYSQLKLMVDNMINESDGKVLNAVETGTSYLKGGDDVDLYLVTDSDLSAADLSDLRERLVVEGLEVHVFSCTRDEFESGNIVHNKKGRPLSEYLGAGQVGFDPHLEEIDYEHPGMVNLFLFGTMRQFSTVNTLESVSIESSLEKVKVDYEDVREWVQLYTAVYLGQYLSESPSGSDFQHAERISKFLIRVLHGDLMEHLNPDELTGYIAGLKHKIHTLADNDQSPDDLFATEIISNYKSMTPEDIRLVSVARDIRKGVSDIAEPIIEIMEALLMYEAMHFRLDSRVASEGSFNTLSILAMHHLCQKFSHKGAEEMIFEPNDRLITAGADEDWLFLIPPYRLDANGAYVKNGSIRVELVGGDVELAPGRTIGELGAIFGSKRSNNVYTDVEPVFAIKISREAFLNELLDPYVINELKSGDIQSSEARMAHSLLMFTMFDISTKLRDRTLRERLKYDFHETDAWLAKDNPLDVYLLDQKFLKAMAILEEANFMLGDTRLVEKKHVGDVTYTLIERNAPVNGKFYVLGEGCTATIKPDGDDGPSITMVSGAVFGEAALLGESTRSAEVVVTGGDLYEVDADEFLRLATSNRSISGSDITTNQLMYHIAAVGTKRMLGRLNNEY